MEHIEKRFYAVWRNMVNRCHWDKHPNYPDYGGRGILVCERWKKYSNFEEDMYEEYVYRIEDFGYSTRNKTTLERIDNNKGYSPENCIWADQKQQCKNRRKRILKQDSIFLKSKEIGISVNTVRSRLRRGWPIWRALCTPPDMTRYNGNKYTRAKNH